MNPIILMGVFEVKHFLADFLLQSEFHLGKFKEKGWVLPLAHHCMIHALGTMLILTAIRTSAAGVLLMALLDFVCHFCMDRVKASPKMLGRFKGLSSREYPTATSKEKWDNKLFWWFLGLDQAWHNFTHLAIVYFVTR